MLKRINEKLFEVFFNTRFLLTVCDKETVRTYLKLLIKKPFTKGKGSILFKGKRIYYPDFHDFFYMWTEIFVRHVYKIDVSSNNPVIFDCGGNIGLASVYYKMNYPDSRLLVFEPLSQNLEYLKKNVNQFSDVEVFETALSDKEGKAFLYTKVGDVCGGGSSLYENNGENIKNEVKLSLLSDWIKEVDCVDIIKMDVEGSETLIVKNLDRENVLNKIRFMVGEYHFVEDWKENSISDFSSTLQKHNIYTRLFVGDEPPVRQIVKKDHKYHTHFVCKNFDFTV